MNPEKWKWTVLSIKTEIKIKHNIMEIIKTLLIIY